MKILLYVGGGGVGGRGVEGGLVFVLDLSGIVGGFEAFGVDLDLWKIFGNDRRIWNEILMLIWQLAILFRIDDVGLDGGGWFEVGGVGTGFGELVRRDKNNTGR